MLQLSDRTPGKVLCHNLCTCCHINLLLVPFCKTMILWHAQYRRCVQWGRSNKVLWQLHHATGVDKSCPQFRGPARWQPRLWVCLPQNIDKSLKSLCSTYAQSCNKGIFLFLCRTKLTAVGVAAIVALLVWKVKGSQWAWHCLMTWLLLYYGSQLFLTFVKLVKNFANVIAQIHGLMSPM